VALSVSYLQIFKKQTRKKQARKKTTTKNKSKAIKNRVRHKILNISTGGI
jgi:hypothetical protein